MSPQDLPTPPAPAEVCERLKNWQWFCENTAKAFLRYEMPIEHIKELGETLTAALLLIEQGEKERERLEEWSDAKTALADDMLSEGRELRAYRNRLTWLHTGSDKDAEGYEWGVFRVKWDEHGQPASVLHTLTDLTDLDAAMGASRMPRYYDEVDDLRQQLAAATERVKRLEESLSDMVCMSETLIKNIAEFSKDPRILTTPSPRLDSARQLLATREQPTPESK